MTSEREIEDDAILTSGNPSMTDGVWASLRWRTDMEGLGMRPDVTGRTQGCGG